MRTAFYYLGLALLFSHELDAVQHEEWRLLFVLRDLSAERAAALFVALHVPLFFAVLWLSHHPGERIRSWTRDLVAAFLVVHAILHFSLSSSAAYDFNGALSSSLIVSAAACGVACLILQRGHFARPASKQVSERGRGGHSR